MVNKATQISSGAARRKPIPHEANEQEALFRLGAAYARQISRA